MMEGCVAFITGAAKGIGHGLAEALLKRGAKVRTFKRGAKVCLADCDVASGQNAQDMFNKKYGDGKTVFVKCDVTSQDDITAAFAKAQASLGCVEIVFNNAGVNVLADQWELMVNVNLNGVIRGTRTAIECMRKDKGGNGGTVVNVSSLVGLIPNPIEQTYTATKYAIVGYTRSQALNKEFAANGLKFMTLCPSVVETGLVQQSMGVLSDADNEFRDAIVTRDGIMSVEEISEAAMELLSDKVESGAVLLVSKNKGLSYISFPDY